MYQVDGLIDELIKAAIGDKGYCTKEDFVFRAVMEPYLHLSETKAGEAFDRMVQDGDIIEIESGRYRPREKLSDNGGD